MPLRQSLNEAYKSALRERDHKAVSTLRMALAALKDKDIAARPKGVADGVAEDEVMTLLQAMIKQRRESIELYRQGARADLVEGEQAEIAILERFLPAQLDEAETASAVAATAEALGAASVKDMGRVMAELKAAYAGRMDFTRASALVKQRLGGA